MISGGGCPLTYSYSQELMEGYVAHDGRPVQVADLMYEDLVEDCRELLSRARKSIASSADQYLRAFYCLEVMYHLLLPRELMKARVSEPELSIVFSAGVPRSVDGLMRLLAALDDLKKYMTVAATESDMVGARIGAVRADTSSLRRSRMEDVVKLVEKIERVAHHLRSSLNKEEPGLHPIGVTFAEALHLVNEPFNQCLRYGSTLLNISETTGITAWNQQER